MPTQSLHALLPARLTTPRLTLELFDGSPAHYGALLGAINSPSAHARMGDYGIRTSARFDEINASARLRASAMRFSKDVQIDVDFDVYYLPRIREADGLSEGPLMGGVSIQQRSESLPPDVGWCFLEEYHGHGYAAEAARALLDCTRDVLHIHEVMTIPGENNVPSRRTAEKAGFVRGGVVNGSHGSEFLVYVLPGMDFERIRGTTISLF